jgi:hypothetical protein
MAKTMNRNSTSTEQANGTQKERKKQAKREARALLAVERAKASVEKAQRKLAKAQERLESRNTHLHTLENNLSELRSSSHESDDHAPQHGLNGQSEQTSTEQNPAAMNEQEISTVPAESQQYVKSEEDETGSDTAASTSSVNTPVPTDQEVSLPPTEGREDILPEDQARSDAQESAQNELSHEENY